MIRVLLADTGAGGLGELARRLRDAGAEVIVLGDAGPVPHLVRAVEQEDPALVGIGPDLSGAAELAAALPGRVVFGYGEAPAGTALTRVFTDPGLAADWVTTVAVEAICTTDPRSRAPR
ncbi:hypothetical protein [Amycolatopsis suaedae]|uniref:Uncharacterized protein n=1 Tax=Amycolatopsis suaedae TaxID=2510978 RepID=A0A4Q7J9U7_9PSEU|nr:hypothetical protein [Amycolatopsis suaedae]RZQ64019.1 hypothetical protein EWH70_08415 [Amycolatopsis suaedae]